MLRDDRVNTLQYVRAGALPATPTRLIALAVIGLIWGGIAFIASAAIAIVCGYASITEPPRVVPPPPPPLEAVSLTPYRGDPFTVDGIAKAQRDEIIQRADEQLKLSADRAHMLDRLLADVGARFVAASAKIELKEFGKDPAGDDWFITARGKVVIGDFYASFIPDGGPVVRLMRNVLHDGDHPPRWSAIAIGEKLDEAQARFDERLSALQAAAILRGFQGQVATSDASWKDRPRFMELIRWQHGTLKWAPFDDVSQWVLTDGRSASVNAAPLGVDPLSGVPYTRIVPRPHRLVPGHRGVLAVLSVVALGEALLAAYLLVGAMMVIRSSWLGLSRLVRYALLRIPATVIGLVALTWWMLSLQHYAVGGYPPKVAPIGYAFASLGFGTMVMLLLRSRRVQHFLSAAGQDPWDDLRLLVARIRVAPHGGHGLVLAGAAGTLGIFHLALWFLCTWRFEASALQIAVHLIGAFLSLVIAGLVVYWRVRAAGISLRPVVGRLSVVFLLLCAGSHQPMAPWVAQETLSQARSPDRDLARSAVRQLANAGEAGQEAILQLLEGPAPPIGIDAILVIVGEQWNGRDMRWPAVHADRALRLSLEWIESIQRTRDSSGVALLEAMGSAPELEPLLRPLLVCDEEAIRTRASRLLLRINPRPLGVIGLLRRQLSEESDRRSRESIIAALILLRPASDSALARVLHGKDPALAEYMLTRMLTEQSPWAFSSEMSAALLELSAADNPKLQRASVDLLTRDRKGRATLIELSLEDSGAGSLARNALARLWPGIEPLYWRLTDSRDVDRCRDAARCILLVLNESNGSIQKVEQLGGAADADSELSLQSRLVAAAGEYGSRLGPNSYQAIRRHVEPGSASPVPQATWRVAHLTVGAEVLRKTRLPMWISIMLLIMTLALPAFVLTWGNGGACEDSGLPDRACGKTGQSGATIH